MGRTNKQYQVREMVCDWALDIPLGDTTVVLHFNSRNNAELVKAILEHEDAHPNEAVPFILPQPSNELPPCYTEEKRNTAYPLCAGRGFANCAHCALWSDFEEDQDETRINRPLTLEELREMNEEPVWVQNLEDPGKSQWRLLYWDRGKYLVLQGISVRGYLLEEYGESWLAYRRPPEVSP